MIAVLLRKSDNMAIIMPSRLSLEAQEEVSPSVEEGGGGGHCSGKLISFPSRPARVPRPQHVFSILNPVDAVAPKGLSFITVHPLVSASSTRAWHYARVMVVLGSRKVVNFLLPPLLFLFIAAT